jgi:hypothetical protein
MFQFLQGSSLDSATPGYFGHVKDAKTSARSLLAGLQGAQMGCRMVPDRFIRFDAIAAHLLQPFED